MLQCSVNGDPKPRARRLPRCVPGRIWKSPVMNY